MGGPVITSRGEHTRRSRPLLRTKIGERLRRTRREQGRTLSDVSRASRVSVPYLSEVERGRKEASSEVLAAICDALWIDLSDLLAGVARDLAADQGRLGTVIRLNTGELGHGPDAAGWMWPAAAGRRRRRAPRARPGACWRRNSRGLTMRPAAPAA